MTILKDKKTRVLLAEDHSLVRAGICALLRNMEWIEVVAEASNGAETLRLIQQHLPDIVLLDIAMPELSGLEVAEQVCSKYPNINVIILSMHNNEEYILQALRAGASGYLLKDASPMELELALQSVRDGGTYLSPSVSHHVISSYVNRTGTEIASNRVHLTPRQKDVLKMIARGLTTKQIATVLKISSKSVETHRTQLMNKLNIHNVAGLVRYAINTGMIDSNE
jgi:DNA-binding NarL/FixJ family response regulator